MALQITLNLEREGIEWEHEISRLVRFIDEGGMEMAGLYVPPKTAQMLSDWGWGTDD